MPAGGQASVIQSSRLAAPAGEVCLTLRPRAALAAMPGSARISRATVAWLFRHRHKRLVAWFGAER